MKMMIVVGGSTGIDRTAYKGRYSGLLMRVMRDNEQVLHRRPVQSLMFVTSSFSDHCDVDLSPRCLEGKSSCPGVAGSHGRTRPNCFAWLLRVEVLAVLRVWQPCLKIMLRLKTKPCLTYYGRAGDKKQIISSLVSSDDVNETSRCRPNSLRVRRNIYIAAN